MSDFVIGQRVRVGERLATVIGLTRSGQIILDSGSTVWLGSVKDYEMLPEFWIVDPSEITRDVESHRPPLPALLPSLSVRQDGVS